MALEGRPGFYKPVRVKIPIPTDMLVSIGKKKVSEGGKDIWLKSHMLESSAWDTIGRILGISYSNPEVKFMDKQNCIIEITATYFNEYGTKISDTCQYHNDCNVIYEKMRMDWQPKVKWFEGKPTSNLENASHKGFPKEEISYDEKGLPVIRVVLPQDVEFDLKNNLFTLERHRHKKAETCCRRSLVQRAIGKKLANLKDGDKSPCIEITRFVPATTLEEAQAALDDLVPDLNELQEEPQQDFSGSPPPPTEDSNECSVCKAIVTNEVKNYSLRFHKRVLCKPCQGAKG